MQLLSTIWVTAYLAGSPQEILSALIHCHQAGTGEAYHPQLTQKSSFGSR
jgi:hypothetical protein